MLIAGAVFTALAPGFPARSIRAQRSEPAVIEARRVDEPVRIDGQLTEEAWQGAQHITNFTQRELDFGRPATERTEVAILFDETTLYVGFWGYDDSPERILATRMQRDFSWGSEDNFAVIIDTFNDDRNGYLFVTNPNGARADALVRDNGSTVNRDWDGVWEARARVTYEGWFAELRIPLSTLRFGPDAEAGWGINFERYISRKREQVFWQGWSRDFNLDRVSQAGSLTGLSGIRSQSLLEVKPHLVGGAEWTEEDGRSSMRDMGLDVIHLFNSNLKLNLTVNPDFAQVESDREEVNLTRFSLYYPEKRQFFLEGQEFFDFELGDDVRPFYSRRIGLAADRTEIPITGGARLLGRFEGTTLGAMLLRTRAEGSEPAANFGVVRWKRDVLEESSIGLLAVGRIEPGRTNTILGTDLLFATSELFGDKEFEAGLSLAGSHTSDAAAELGLAHRLFFSYPNDLIEFSASWTGAAAAFNPEVGFMRRGAFERYASELAICPRPRFLPFIQQIEIKPYEISWYTDGETGELESFYAACVPLAFTTRSGDGREFNLQRRAERLTEPFEILEGEEIPAGTYWFTRWAADLESFSGRRLSGSVELGGGEFYLGRRFFQAASATWMVNRFLSLGADFERNTITFSGEELRVDEAGGRLDFAFSPVLFGAVAGQWNNEDEEVILNFRINWIPEPGSDLFLVINHLAETEDAIWSPVQTTLISKLVWRFAF